MPLVIIAHRDGRQYGVSVHDFRTAKVGPAGETYEELGYKIISNEDGTPYEAGKGSGGEGESRRGRAEGKEA